MGHSSKHGKSKSGRSKRDDGKRAEGREKSARPSITHLQDLIANIEERQLSLARQHEEYTRLQEQAENLQERLEEAEYTLSLLSSTSLVAQQARGVVPMPTDPGQQIIDNESRRRHLRSEVANLPVSIDEYNRRAQAMAELISRNEEEIHRLQAQVDEISAAEEAEAQAGWYLGRGGPGWDGWPGSGGGYGGDDGDFGGGSYGYRGGGQTSSSTYYGQYASGHT
ncbi:hypothetical protein N0V84_012643 [Fusarium piperis]|uniref:Uncharacterized protein n=1 Tax=Fusarium piperis TaxID=1435070 RepID=A0A9W8W3F5_9HYPO|nr:hypothetical protein N0V84_012643 [Fusarium piperis]